MHLIGNKTFYREISASPFYLTRFTLFSYTTHASTLPTPKILENPYAVYSCEKLQLQIWQLGSAVPLEQTSLLLELLWHGRRLESYNFNLFLFLCLNTHVQYLTTVLIQLDIFHITMEKCFRRNDTYKSEKRVYVLKSCRSIFWRTSFVTITTRNPFAVRSYWLCTSKHQNCCQIFTGRSWIQSDQKENITF